MELIQRLTKFELDDEVMLLVRDGAKGDVFHAGDVDAVIKDFPDTPVFVELHL